MDEVSKKFGILSLELYYQYNWEVLDSLIYIIGIKRCQCPKFLLYAIKSRPSQKDCSRTHLFIQLVALSITYVLSTLALG